MKLKSIKVGEMNNPKWSHLVSNMELTIKKKDVFSSFDSIYTIGSCFAEEIRKSLSSKNFNLFPKFEKLKFDKLITNIDTLPNRSHMNFYNLPAILQEFRRSENSLKIVPSDFIIVKDTTFKMLETGQMRFVKQKGQTVYHDILRRWNWSNSLDELIEVSQKISELTFQGITQSNVAVITLGMSEVFMNQKFVANEMPAHLHGKTNYIPKLLTSSQNLYYLREITNCLRALNNKLKIIFTISPVALIRTFLSNDIYTANLVSKSNLISALFEFMSENPKNVHYFPSYEIVNMLGWDAFKDDKRHVKETTANIVVNTFQASYQIKEKV